MAEPAAFNRKIPGQYRAGIYLFHIIGTMRKQYVPEDHLYNIANRLNFVQVVEYQFEGNPNRAIEVHQSNAIMGFILKQEIEEDERKKSGC